MQVQIRRTDMCRGIQIQKLLQNPVIIIREPGQINLVLQLKVAKIIVPRHDQKVPDTLLLPGASLVVGTVLAVRVNPVTEVTDLPDHRAVLQDLHIVHPDHQVVPQDLRFDHQDHQVVHPGHRVVPPDHHPDQVVPNLQVLEERDKNSC